MRVPLNDMRYTSINWLKSKECSAIDESLAMMAYNPAVGRVLRQGGVIEFKKLAIKKVGRLKKISTQKEFDSFQEKFIKDVMKTIKRTALGKKISYGHGQKAVNVFLKVYIDWASYPTPQIANKLRKFLHVPLDYWVMWYIKKEHPESLERLVKPAYQRQGKRLYAFSLSDIDIKIYRAWQELCRNICPDQPVLLDVIWAKAPR